MKQREGRLVYGPDEQYTLRDIPLIEGILWISGSGKTGYAGMCITRNQMATGTAIQASCRFRSMMDVRHAFG